MAKQDSKDITVLPIYFDYVLGSKFPVIILVGGRNSGKSYFMEQNCVINLNDKTDYTLLVVEDVETNIGAGVKDGIEERIEEFESESFFSSIKSPPEVKHNNGNKVIFKGYHSKKQQKQVKSLNGITAAWYEEAENITYQQFKALRMQLRGGEPQDRQLFLSMNPINEEGFINKYFFRQKADEVIERFEDGRKKVFIKNISVDIGKKTVDLPCLVVVSTYKDNKFLTDEQIADILEYEQSDPDKYEMLANGKFTTPKGRLLKSVNQFSLSRMDLSQAANTRAIVDTASSGKDSATLGIYAKYDEEHHYLIDAIKDPSDAKIVIHRMVAMLNRYKPSEVWIEKNHEGLYFESEFKRLLHPHIQVKTFHSTENKHEKILGQSGKMRQFLYFRDDAGIEYIEFKEEVLMYNRDPKLNDHDDCIDNVAMYFKKVDSKAGWGWS